MAKRKAVIDPVIVEPSETVEESAAITKPPTEVQLPARPNGSPQYEKLVATHLVMAAPCQHVGDIQTKGGMQIKGMMTDASYDLYKELNRNSGDAPESILSLLAVSVTNATLDCLAQAARLPTEQHQLRDLNLRHGLKGASVAADLLKVMKELRGEKPEKVSVGNVNVQAGGQAIVGTVEAPRSPEVKSKN